MQSRYMDDWNSCSREGVSGTRGCCYLSKNEYYYFSTFLSTLEAVLTDIHDIIINKDLESILLLLLLSAMVGCILTVSRMSQYLPECHVM